MKDRWKNNIGLKVMAVLFATFLWWAVVNVDDPINAKKFNTEVTVLHPEIITNSGKSYQIVEDTKNITVTVRARRKVLEKIKAEHIQATADFRELQGVYAPIRVHVIGFEGAYEEITTNPRNIQVKTEDIIKRTLPISTMTTGNVKEGYVVGELTADTKTIDISGPKSSVGRINKVVASVDVANLSEDASLKATLIYYDSADNVIDQSLLTSSCDANGVTVKVDLLETKKLEIKFDTSGIKPARGYAFNGITVEPQYLTVSLAGDQETEIKAIEVPKNALKMSGVTQNVEMVVDITEYLPEGVKLVDENAKNVLVHISIVQKETNSVSLPVGSIQVLNESIELTHSYGETMAVELLFTAASDEMITVLQNLKPEQIEATIDLKGYQEEGTYEVPVKVTKLPDGCVYSENASVQIILKKK